MQSRLFIIALLATSSLTASAASFSTDGSEEQKHLNFLAAYNEQPARKRSAALHILDKSKDQRSIETLFSVSWRDPDPEVRSRAFFSLVHCEDQYGYTAYLAAESFKRETEPGVKVEKAVNLNALRYKWSALNELVTFLHSLRWSYWQWNPNTNGGYIANGDAPESPSDTPKPAVVRSGYDEWRDREPLRWRTEEELIGLVTNQINHITGTQMESRPRIDQEITKWWERKGDSWADYDRKLRNKSLASSRDIVFKDVKNIHDADIKAAPPVKDAALQMVEKSLLAKDQPAIKRTVPLTGPVDE